MSIKLMCAAFDTDVPATQKLVLLALCDNANDQGHCFPSVSLLERKCSLSDRTVQTAIGWLEKHGYLTRQFRTGRATLYIITPEAGSPLTIREPSSNRQKRKGTLLEVEQLPDEWAVFCKETRPDLKPKEVFDTFRDYWIAQPGQKAYKTNWLATWRNWVRNTRVSPNSQPAKQDRKSTLIFGDWSANVIDMEDANGRPIPLR